MSITLRQYQEEISREAQQKLLQNKFVYLSMEVRCGKTLTALHCLDSFFFSKVLFITKKKAISSIVSDYKALSPAYDLTVTNYDQLHNISETFDAFVIDEAHSLGSFPKPSLRAKLVRDVISRCENPFVIFLSGTPTPESYSQMFHQMWVLGRLSPFAKYINFYRWANDYVKVWQRVINGNRINVYDNAIQEKVMGDMSKHMISFTQSQAGFTTSVNENVLHVKMSDQTYQMCDKLKKDLVLEGKGDVILADTPVKLMQKLHQMYSGTIILESGKRLVFDTTKAEFIRERFKGKRIAVFYKFQAELDCLLSVFQEDMTTDLGKFHAGDCDNFAIQIVTGREGISLKQADYLVYYNIDFSATSYWQSRDRLTTMDRLSNEVFWVFAEGGIEDKIYKVVQSKKNFTISHFKKDFL